MISTLSSRAPILMDRTTINIILLRFKYGPLQLVSLRYFECSNLYFSSMNRCNANTEPRDQSICLVARTRRLFEFLRLAGIKLGSFRHNICRSRSSSFELSVILFSLSEVYKGFRQQRNAVVGNNIFIIMCQRVL